MIRVSIVQTQSPTTAGSAAFAQAPGLKVLALPTALQQTSLGRDRYMPDAWCQKEDDLYSSSRSR